MDLPSKQVADPLQRLPLLCILWTARPIQAELLRTTCAVLIRRIMVPSGPHWARLDGSAKAALRAGLLSAIGTETSSPVARKVSDETWMHTVISPVP